jgi:hypothetical protein
MMMHVRQMIEKDSTLTRTRHMRSPMPRAPRCHVGTNAAISLAPGENAVAHRSRPYANDRSFISTSDSSGCVAAAAFVA